MVLLLLLLLLKMLVAKRQYNPIIKWYMAHPQWQFFLLRWYGNLVFFYPRNFLHTGKSLSEALLFSEHGENILCTKIVLNVRNNFCTQHVLSRIELGIFMYWTCNSMNNLSSYCGLVDAKIRASDKDLPVCTCVNGPIN